MLRTPCKIALSLATSLLVALAAPTMAGALDTFLPAVGVWRTETDSGKEVLKVDGSVWKRGQLAPQLQQSAVRIFGEKAPMFIRSVMAAANSPIAIFAGVQDFQAGALTVRFKPQAGKSGQAGGIFFDLHENGNYYVLRANALEDTLILFQYKFGQRYTLKEAKNAPAKTGAWHDLKVVLNGKTVQGYLNGKQLLEYTLGQEVTGKVGLWSKDDSVVLFEGFRAQPVE